MNEHVAEFDHDYDRKRNLDRRRESSRFAARDRRGREANIFMDLKEVLPIVDEPTVTHVDRIALLRVASTFCRLREVIAKLPKQNFCEEPWHVWSETTLIESLDGFLVIVDLDGVILYVTESVSLYLGLTQTDLTGRLLKEFVHASDYEEFVTCDIGNTGEIGNVRMLTLRMKSVVSPRGRNLNLKNALYKPIVCCIRSLAIVNGRVRVVQGSAQPAGQNNNTYFTARSVEIPNGVYMTRHTCDMKFSYISEDFNYALCHEARSLMGTSFYNLVHPADLNEVVVAMREMLIKGHARTPYYRLIGINKSVLWVQTEATAVNHMAKGHKGQYVICVHELLGAQSENDSFINGNSCTAVKQEKQNSPDAATSNYDEILQWLFRAQNSSQSPPRTLFRAITNQSRPESPAYKRIETISYGSKNGITVSGTIDYSQEGFADSSSSDNGGIEFGSMGTKISRCGSRTDNTRTDFGGGRANGSALNCTVRCSQPDFRTESTLDPLQLSTVSTTDAYILPDGNIVDNRTTSGRIERNASDMFTALSSSGPQYTHSVTCDPYLTNLSVPTADAYKNSTQFSLPPSPVDSTTEIQNSQKKEINDNGALGNCDEWQMFAPFVAHDDMMQLSTDLQGLLPDFNFVDWIPSDPAPLSNLPATDGEMTSVENIPLPMQMVFGLSELTGTSISRPNSFGLAGYRSVTAKHSRQIGIQKTGANEMNSVSSTWRYWQQHCQQQNTTIAASWTGSCTYSNSSVSAVSRKNTMIQQQQRA